MNLKILIALSSALFASVCFAQSAVTPLPLLNPTGSPAPAAQAPDAQAPGAASTRPDDDLLGPPFVSQTFAISFRPPAESVEITRPGPDTIVEFDRDDYNWTLKCWRERLEKSIPLVTTSDQLGRPQPGVLDIVLNNIRNQTPGVKVLRNEVINVGRVRVGMIAVRYETADHQRRITQQAIFEAPDANDQLYYFLELTGPGKPADEPEDIVNPAEQMAAETFAKVVDSTELLDRSKIVNDQKQRLFETIGLFINWTGADYQPVRSAIIPEQWQRIVKDGKDVGYSYIAEEYNPNVKSPDDATIRVSVRTRMLPTPQRQWDTETVMTSTVDRKHESWSIAARISNPKGEPIDSFTQLATSDEQTKPVPLREETQQDNGALTPQGDERTGGPLGQGPIDIATLRTLEVDTTHRQTELRPFRMDVPTFYVPQAFSYLLPSLLPLDHPKSYMFAVFVPADPTVPGQTTAGQVMARYLDVLPVQDVAFNGQHYQAVEVQDKIGLSGPITTYYFTPGGKFLGSGSSYAEGDKQTSVLVLPTDQDTLQRLWERPNLTRAKALER